MPEINIPTPKKILIIMMGGIGNMIFLTPALKSLRVALPHTEFCYLLGPYGADQVIEGSELFDKKIIIETDTYKGAAGRIKLIRRLRHELFDLSITSTGTNPLKSGLLCWLSGIKFRLGENIKNRGLFYNLKIPYRTDRHEVDCNLDLVRKLGIADIDKNLFIQISEQDETFAEEIFHQHGLEDKLVVGMHPGSGIHQAEFKRWPAERYARLADWMITHIHASVILFGGTEETELAEDIQKMMSSSLLIMTGKTSLAQTAALIKNCSHFISNDSGLLHVACAVQTPTLSIFGPTAFCKTGPYAESSTIIRKDLACSPCYVGKPVQCSHLNCLDHITVDDMIEAVKNKFENDV